MKCRWCGEEHEGGPENCPRPDAKCVTAPDGGCESTEPCMHTPPDGLPPSDRGLAQRDKDAKEAFNRTKDPKAATRAYCAGNKWLTENAKGVGNW